jgi:hypothetical protein
MSWTPADRIDARDDHRVLVNRLLGAGPSGEG